MEAKMTFMQQILATLIGTVAGFTFSLFLFYIKEQWAKINNEEFVINNTITEISLDISILKKIKDNLNKAIEQITVDDKSAYANIDYSRIARNFLIQFYKTGLMNKILTLDEIDNLNSHSITFSAGYEVHVTDSINDYRDGKSDNKKALQTVSYERSLLDNAINDLTNILKTINNYNESGQKGLLRQILKRLKRPL